jgi:hypothetical protein
VLAQQWVPSARVRRLPPPRRAAVGPQAGGAYEGPGRGRNVRAATFGLASSFRAKRYHRAIGSGSGVRYVCTDKRRGSSRICEESGTNDHRGHDQTTDRRTPARIPPNAVLVVVEAEPPDRFCARRIAAALGERLRHVVLSALIVDVIVAVVIRANGTQRNHGRRTLHADRPLRRTWLLDARRAMAEAAVRGY